MATIFKISHFCVLCSQNQNCSGHLQCETHLLTNFQWILRDRFLLVWFSLCIRQSEKILMEYRESNEGKKQIFICYKIKAFLYKYLTLQTKTLFRVIKKLPWFRFLYFKLINNMMNENKQFLAQKSQPQLVHSLISRLQRHLWV